MLRDGMEGNFDAQAAICGLVYGAMVFGFAVVA